MAAYASTTTVDQKNAERISRNMGMITGVCDVTNYNTTLVEITKITRFFVTVFSVLAGISDNGHTFLWVRASKAFKAFKTALPTGSVVVTGGQAAGTAVQITPDTDAGVFGKTAATTRTIPFATFGLVFTAGGLALAESASDVDVGEAQFVAFGLIRE